MEQQKPQEVNSQGQYCPNRNMGPATSSRGGAIKFMRPHTVVSGSRQNFLSRLYWILILKWLSTRAFCCISTHSLPVQYTSSPLRCWLLLFNNLLSCAPFFHEQLNEQRLGFSLSHWWKSWSYVARLLLLLIWSARILAMFWIFI